MLYSPGNTQKDCDILEMCDATQSRSAEACWSEINCSQKFKLFLGKLEMEQWNMVGLCCPFIIVILDSISVMGLKLSREGYRG